MNKREITNVKNSDAYIARLVEVARAYYQEDQTQAEIARSLGLSRSLISRYLTTARELGIVQITIAAPEWTFDALGRALRGRYPHLKAVVIAPTFSDEPDAQRAMIGRFAANYLAEVLQPGMKLALGCGRTLRATVDALSKRSIAGVSVVQAMGSIGHEAHHIDYNEIARKAADSLGGQAHYVSAPAILGSGNAAEFVAANPTLRHSLGLASSADVYVVGLGTLESDQLYARVGLIRDHELGDLRGRAVGDICGRFFDIDGKEQSTAFADRIVGIELEHLHAAPLSIGVAGGDDKVAPLLGALRGGYVNALVSDEHTLQALLRLEDENT
ncbi:MAG: sugar-binding transcriptional regulator [Anaerolineae bacterium]|nr:sugar-binding transcriptional regulator [Anaerolineae bacterium]